MLRRRACVAVSAQSAATAALQIAGRLQIMSAAEVAGYCCGVALVAVYGVVHVAHVFVGDAAAQGVQGWAEVGVLR